MVTSVVVDMVTSTLPVFLALGTALVALAGTALKWLTSHTHPGRLLVLETKASKADTDIGTALATLGSHTADIAKLAAVTETVVPGLDKDVTAHAKEISDLKAKLADLTGKINLITTVIPLATPVVAGQTVPVKP